MENTDKIDKWRYGVISIIATIFLGFIVGIYGVFIYMKERKYRMKS